MIPDNFSPKEFLKNRRPERFSDSISQVVTELDRSLLEYHLDSLTSRGQETNFERFAKRLAEYEICPNLLPQTGPTGGGDSKVDSETYPVADRLALTWFTGVGREASGERWAFAFSAKKDWQPKVKSDVSKIEQTNRGYAKAFFITNQAVPDRKRAKVEDELTKKHKLDVRILDRTWILDRVFSNKRENLAIEELGITGLSRTNLKKGLLDTKREDDLTRIEARIEEKLQQGIFNHNLVDDCLEAADLARQLERPRVEVEGRYARLDRLALEFGTLRQQVESAYQWAWTLYWWFEDYTTFASQYKKVEERAKGSRNSYDLERLSTLWTTLSLLSHEGIVQSEVEAHTETLRLELKRLSQEIDRPSTALQAETMLIEMELSQSFREGKSFDDSLTALRSVVQRSEGLVGYPLEPLVKILTEIAATLDGSKAYDELFETLIQVTSNRDGEIRAAQLLLNRGEGQLENNRIIEAIATFGRALGLLYKHETREEVVEALYLCAKAYELAGLPWAARGTLISAVSIATNDFWQYGNITPYQVFCSWKLKWLELRLGRLPQILTWHEIASVLNLTLAEKRERVESTFEGEDSFDLLLGRLMLRLKLSELSELISLPDKFYQLGLHFSAEALLYALGHEDEFAEGAKLLDLTAEEAALKMRDFTADGPLAEKLVLYKDEDVVLQSKILGCKIIVKTSCNSPSLEIAESFLAALESFLATSTLKNAIAREPLLNVEIKVTDGLNKLISSDMQERSGRPYLIINCQPFNPHEISVEAQRRVRDALLHVTIETLANIIFFKETEKDIEALFRDEKVVDRAISFSGMIGVQANVLGYNPKTLLTSWIEPEATVYPLLRKEPWDVNKPIIEEKLPRKPLNRADPNTEPPSELLDPNQMTHDQIEVVSLIRERLWNQARWSGAFFMRYEDADYPPFLGLVFRERDSGSEIFRQWIEELGKVDVEEKLRVLVVRGIDKEQPHAYRIVLGPDPAAYDLEKRYFTYMYRVHRMDAVTPKNLSDFLNHHKKIGSFFLVPAFVPSDWDGTTAPDMDLDLRILVRNVYARYAWEIGLNDPDAKGIQEEDDPIIPEEVTEPPILKLLQKRQSSRG
jgi:tetratricopeptide (TPR) repeat protein